LTLVVIGRVTNDGTECTEKRLTKGRGLLSHRQIRPPCWGTGGKCHKDRHLHGRGGKGPEKKQHSEKRNNLFRGVF